MIHSIFFALRAWQSFSTTSLQVLFGLPLGLGLLAFLHPIITNTNAVSSIPNLSLSSLLGNLSFSLTPHIHLTILISARRSATSFSFLTGQVSLPRNMLLHTQLLYNIPLIINDMSLLISSGTNCLNLFLSIRILAFTAASASPFTLSI